MPHRSPIPQRLDHLMDRRYHQLRVILVDAVFALGRRGMARIRDEPGKIVLECTRDPFPCPARPPHNRRAGGDSMREFDQWHRSEGCGQDHRALAIRFAVVPTPDVGTTGAARFEVQRGSALITAL